MKKVLRNYRVTNEDEFEKECDSKDVKALRLNDREIMLEGKERNIWYVIEYLEELQRKEVK